MTDATSSPLPSGRADAGTPPAHPAPARGLTAPWRLWFGLFAAPAAWSVQLLANTAIASHGCFPALYPRASSAGVSVRGLTLAVSAVAVTAGVVALVVAWGSWTRTRHEHQQGSGGAREHPQRAAALETGEGRTRFMALSGVMMSVTFLVAVVAHTASVLMVGPCGA